MAEGLKELTQEDILNDVDANPEEGRGWTVDDARQAYIVLAKNKELREKVARGESLSNSEISLRRDFKSRNLLDLKKGLDNWIAVRRAPNADAMLQKELISLLALRRPPTMPSHDEVSFALPEDRKTEEGQKEIEKAKEERDRKVKDFFRWLQYGVEWSKMKPTFKDAAKNDLDRFERQAQNATDSTAHQKRIDRAMQWAKGNKTLPSEQAELLENLVAEISVLNSTIG